MLSKAESWLKDSLDYEFKDARLFELALTHRSAPGDNNERLEFLGDAVLDFVISEVVFRSHPLAPEGDLSRLRASLVNDATLAQIAAGLGLGEHLILGSGERKTGGHRRNSILADALEAIFGAVYLDAGFDASRWVIERTFGERLLELGITDAAASFASGHCIASRYLGGLFVETTVHGRVLALGLEPIG